MYANPFTEKLTVTVTQKDINAGAKCVDSKCPIARAVNKHFGPNYKTYVSDNTLQITTAPGNYTYECHTYNLSRSASRFVRKFDDKGRKHVRPATFIFRRVERLTNL